MWEDDLSDLQPYRDQQKFKKSHLHQLLHRDSDKSHLSIKAYNHLNNLLIEALVYDGKQIQRIESWFFKRVVVVAENCDLEDKYLSRTHRTKIRKAAYGSGFNVEMGTYFWTSEESKLLDNMSLTEAKRKLDPT